MFENVFKYKFKFLRLFLILYPVILAIDGILIKQNLFWFEFIMFGISAIIGFFAGRTYEDYYFKRKGQKAYPTKRQFNIYLWVSSIIYFFLVFALLADTELNIRLLYCGFRAFVYFVFTYSGFYAREKTISDIGMFIGIMPSVIASVVMFILTPYAVLNANISVLVFIGYVILLIYRYTKLFQNIKKAFGKRIKKGILGKLGSFLENIQLNLNKLTDGIKRFVHSFMPGVNIGGIRALFDKIYKLFWREKEVRYKKNEDYTDEIVSMYYKEEQNSGIKYTLRELRKIRQPAKKIRYAFGLVMSRLYEKKVYIKLYDTVETIKEKSKVIEGLDTPIDELSYIYEKARYGKSEIDVSLSDKASKDAEKADNIIYYSTYRPKEYANIAEDENNGGNDNGVRSG